MTWNIGRGECLFIGLLELCLGLSLSIECPDLWTTFRGSCYLFGTHTPFTFVEAEHYCRQFGGHLVHVETAAENLFIKEYLLNNQHPPSWMGLTDQGVEGLWVWYDTNIDAKFTDWGRGEPNHGDGHFDEDCAVFNPPSGFQWNDAECSAKLEPICEIRTEQEIVG